MKNIGYNETLSAENEKNQVIAKITERLAEMTGEEIIQFVGKCKNHPDTEVRTLFSDETYAVADSIVSRQVIHV